MFTGKKVGILAIAMVIGWVGITTVQAKTLKIALKSEPTSMDPMFHMLTPNIQISKTLFDGLVSTDKDLNPVPGLAESWDVDGNEWTFHLRKDVKFSDGSSFTAKDVLFSFDRVPKVPNSPSSFSINLAKVKNAEAVDPYTLKITTKSAAPTLLQNLAEVMIMSHTAAAGDAPEGKTTKELNRGDGLVGTGPYKFVKWKRGSRIVFERNPNYWGSAPEWDKVVYRPMSNSASRVAALLSGDVDLIEDPSTDDLERLRKDKKLHIQETPSVRIIYVALNQSDKVPNGVKGTGDKNPLQDKRVREALSLALDRKAIVDHIMSGVGTPAANLLPYPSSFGTPEGLSKAADADIEKAKKLLADAGYKDGFTLLLGSPDGRYTNDKDIAQAVASMWARVGVKTDVSTMASAVFFQKRGEYAFSAYLAGWAASTGEMINPLVALLLTKDDKAGTGTTNWSNYSNPKLDKLVEKAAETIDDDKRADLLHKASFEAMDDYAILPIYFPSTVWAMKKDITYAGRSDQATMAQSIKAVK